MPSPGVAVVMSRQRIRQPGKIVIKAGLQTHSGFTGIQRSECQPITNVQCFSRCESLHLGDLGGAPARELRRVCFGQSAGKRDS